ncbi:MAG TPA: YciI family protein [Thermomicrobiales bacterium]|nr:YciI family protein [Thermomicrobiales bacterium]
MARFLVLTTFTSAEKRMAHRAEHRVYLNQLVDEGKLLMAGPFADEGGGLIVFEAVDQAEVEDMMANDPFTINGVFATTDIRPWTLVAGS